MVGSDNVNLRSWTHDSELPCAVLDSTLDLRPPRDPGGRGDGARVPARSLRLTLWAEHLGRVPDDRSMLDPTESLALWRDAAAGSRPPSPLPRVPTGGIPADRWPTGDHRMLAAATGSRALGSQRSRHWCLLVA